MLGPLVGEPAPPAGVRVAGALEPLGIDGRPLVVGRETRERHGPSFADPTTLGLVLQDPVDPGAQRGLAPEAVEPLQYGQPRLLNNLLGRAGRRDVGAGQV